MSSSSRRDPTLSNPNHPNPRPGPEPHPNLPPKQELQEALYSTAGWDSWSKLQEGDDEAQLKLGPSDDGGVPGAHETFGEAGANTEVGIVLY